MSHAFASLAILVAVLLTGGPAMAAHTYVVGVVLSLSGPVAANGVPTRDGILLAAEEVNAAGGVNGHRVEFAFEDDQSKADQAVILATKLINQTRVPILIGGSFGSTANAMAAIVDRQKVPFLTPTAWIKEELRLQPYTFYFLPDFFSVVDRMLELMTKDLGVKRVGLLRLSREYGQLGSDGFQKYKGKYGVEIVREERGADGDTDFTPQLTNIRAAKPDVLVSWFANPAGAISIKNARQLGLTVPILGPVSMANQPTITVGGPAAEGAILQSLIAPADPLPRQRHFVELYQSKRGKSPEVFEAIGYDLGRAAIRALAEGGGGDRPDPTRLREAVEKLQLDGAGAVIKFSAKSHEPDPASIVFVKVQQGKFVRAQR